MKSQVQVLSLRFVPVYLNWQRAGFVNQSLWVRVPPPAVWPWCSSSITGCEPVGPVQIRSVTPRGVAQFGQSACFGSTKSLVRIQSPRLTQISYVWNIPTYRYAWLRPKRTRVRKTRAIITIANMLNNLKLRSWYFSKRSAMVGNEVC